MARRPKTKGLKDLNDVSLSQTSWKSQAACKDTPTSVFFATPKSDNAALALSICKRCPVRSHCLYESIQYGYDGIWGGSNAEQRFAIVSVLLNFDLTDFTKEVSDSYIQIIDRIGKTKNTAIADLVNYKSITMD